MLLRGLKDPPRNVCNMIYLIRLNKSYCCGTVKMPYPPRLDLILAVWLLLLKTFLLLMYPSFKDGLFIKKLFEVILILLQIYCLIN